MALPDDELKDLTIAELRALAEQMAVDLDGKTRKLDILAELQAMGVTWEMYQALNAVDDEPEDITGFDNILDPVVSDVVNDGNATETVVVVPVPVAPPEPEYRVVKLVSENRYFQALGYVFTREHPYVLVASNDASVLIENYNGAFREASPREVKDFYG